MGQRTGRRVAYHITEPTSVQLGVMDAAVVVRADEGISVYIPDFAIEGDYPEHVYSVLAFLVSLDDKELQAMMRERLERHMLEAAADDDRDLDS